MGGNLIEALQGQVNWLVIVEQCSSCAVTREQASEKRQSLLKIIKEATTASAVGTQSQRDGVT